MISNTNLFLCAFIFLVSVNGNQTAELWKTISFPSALPNKTSSDGTQHSLSWGWTGKKSTQHWVWNQMLCWLHCNWKDITIWSYGTFSSKLRSVKYSCGIFPPTFLPAFLHSQWYFQSLKHSEDLCKGALNIHTDMHRLTLFHILTHFQSM